MCVSTRKVPGARHTMVSVVTGLAGVQPIRDMQRNLPVSAEQAVVQFSTAWANRRGGKEFKLDLNTRCETFFLIKTSEERLAYHKFLFGSECIRPRSSRRILPFSQKGSHREKHR